MRKDALLAAYAAGVARWHGLQGAGLGALALVAIGYAGGSLPAASAWLFGLCAAALVAGATLAIWAYGRVLARGLARLVMNLERLKGGRIG